MTQFRVTCYLLYFLVSFSAFAGENNISLSFKYISVHDTLVVRSYLDSAKSKISKTQFDSAEYYFLKAGSLSKKVKFIPGYFDYAGAYASFLYHQLRYKEGLRVSEEHLEIALKQNNQVMLANAYNNIGVLCQALGDMNRSAENYIQALNVSEALGDNRNSRKYYNNLASIFLDLEDKERSLYYAQKGYAFALQFDDSVRMGNSLVNLACSEILNEKYDDAKDHLNQLVSIGYKTKNISLAVDAYLNFSEICLRQKKYEEALTWNRKAHELIDDSFSPDYIVYVYDGMAKSHFYLKNYQQANLFFDRSIQIAEAGNYSKNELKDLYLFGSEVKEGVNQLKDALMYRKKYEALKDSILNETAQINIRELEVKYQTTLKEKALAEQQLVIANHENELQEKNKWILVSVSGMVLVMFVAVVLFLVHRQRQSAAKAERESMLLQAQIDGEEHERARQARELHDGVAGILSAAKMQLGLLQLGKSDEVNKTVYEKALALLKIASGEVRNISHNLAPEIILQEGLDIALSDFCKRVGSETLPVDYYVIGEIPKLTLALELLIYRAVQEAVNNVIKHARATRVIVQVSLIETTLSVSIEDDGIGFDIKAIKRRGLGIQNLVSRIQTLGGVCEISSTPGKGTMIYIVCETVKYLARDKPGADLSRSAVEFVANNS